MSDSSFFLHDTVICHDTAQIEPGVKVWQYSSIQQHAVIKEGCVLGQCVNVGPYVRIGKKCKIQNNVSLYEGVELEDYVFCGPSMVFTNIMVPRSKYPQAESHLYVKTRVKEGVSIGANATIVCGVTLGCYSFIGAGAVVTKDVPNYAVMVGNPARHIGWMSEAGMPLDFSDDEEILCEKSQRVYALRDGGVCDVTVSPTVSRLS